MLREIKEALNITEDIYELIRSTAKAGMTERELFSAAEQKLNGLGYEKGQYLFDFLSGVRTAGIDGGATDKILEKNDLLLVDFSLCHNGAWCDTCRTFFLGSPSKEQKEIYELLLSAMEAGVRKIGPGVPGEDIYEAVMEPIKRKGMKEKMPHHAGHGIGKQPFQKPVFKPGNKTYLKSGDIVTLEPGAYFLQQWGIRIEDDFLVTEEGAQLLFCCPLGIEHFILPTF